MSGVLPLQRADNRGQHRTATLGVPPSLNRRGGLPSIAHISEWLKNCSLKPKFSADPDHKTQPLFIGKGPAMGAGSNPMMR